MRNTNRTLVILSGCTLLLTATCAPAQDWPQWRGPNRDAKVTGFTAPKTWPQQFTQKWKVPVGLADATPALVGDKIYVFARQDTDEVTLCLNAADGKEIWRDKYNAPPVTGAAARHPGPRSSPDVVDGKVITLGVTGILSCLDAAKGTVVWRKEDYKGNPRFFVGMSPIVVDGLVIAHVGGTANGTIVAYDLATGAEKWKWTGDAPAYASPVLMTVEGLKLVVTQTEKNLIALATADGKEMWKAPFTVMGMGYNAATPIVDGQTLIYCGQGRGTTAVKIEKSGDTVTAKELWTNKDLSPQFNTPVLKNGFLYGLSQRGNFLCVNAKTGETAWTDPAGGRGAYGSIVDAGSVLLALTPKSQLIAFEPSEKAYTELASVKVADSESYAYPVLAGNRIFIKDSDSLTLWTLQ